MRALRSERGSELIEFALSATLFFGMVFAILNGGLLIWRYNMLSDLAQEGVRWASVRGSTSSGSFKTNGTKSNLQTYVRSRSSSGSALTVTTSPDADPNTLTPGTTYRVTVTQPLSAWMGLQTWSFSSSATASLPILR